MRKLLSMYFIMEFWKQIYYSRNWKKYLENYLASHTNAEQCYAVDFKDLQAKKFKLNSFSQLVKAKENGDTEEFTFKLTVII